MLQDLFISRNWLTYDYQIAGTVLGLQFRGAPDILVTQITYQNLNRLWLTCENCLKSVML